MIATPIFAGRMYLVRYHGFDIIIWASSSSAAIVKAAARFLNHGEKKCAA